MSLFPEDDLKYKSSDESWNHMVKFFLCKVVIRPGAKTRVKLGG